MKRQLAEPMVVLGLLRINTGVIIFFDGIVVFLELRRRPRTQLYGWLREPLVVEAMWLVELMVRWWFGFHWDEGFPVGVGAWGLQGAMRNEGVLGSGL